MKILDDETELDSFLKAHKTSETKDIFPFEWFDHPDELQKQNFLLLTLFTVNSIANIHFKQNTKSLLIFWKMDWP